METALVDGEGQQAYIQPFAAWKVTLDGTDLTDKLKPRLLSLRLSEKRGEEADELEIELEDFDGKLAIPPEGAVLSVDLGWQRGTPVTAGLVSKGSFRVDEVSWEGPPDVIRITARSADLTGTFRTRKTRIFKGQTIGAIVGKIAGEQGLKSACHPDLSGKAVTAAEQHNKSDMQLLRDLGRRYDAIATVKHGTLIFSPINATTTASGGEIPGVIILRERCSSYSWRRAAREKDQDGAEAQWHDQDAAQRKTVKHGGTKRRRLKRVYASEADATAAATSETQRLKRAAATFEVTLSYGNAIIAPAMTATATGFKSTVDATAWRIVNVEHTMDGRGGFTSRIGLEGEG